MVSATYHHSFGNIIQWNEYNDVTIFSDVHHFNDGHFLGD